jgi:hypothetical protein
VTELLRDLDDRQAALVDQERRERVAKVVRADVLHAEGVGRHAPDAPPPVAPVGLQPPVVDAREDERLWLGPAVE